MLSNMMVYLGIAQVILLLLCFLFILLRLLNLSRGFTELLSIFVQMDNLDIRKIFRFMQFLIGLFGHLNDKNQRMTVQTNSFTNSLSNVSEYDKQNSEGSFTEEQNMISVNANLNKKIKKIELGDQIKKMRTVALAMIIVYLLLVGVGILAINIYATVSLQNYRAFQELGYSTMRNGSLVNILHSGVYEKFRNASIYVPEKYEPYLRQFRERQSSNLDISVSSGSSNYQNLYKQIYY
jgi:predicted PurR-regulated permease PerM